MSAFPVECSSLKRPRLGWGGRHLAATSRLAVLHLPPTALVRFVPAKVMLVKPTVNRDMMRVFATFPKV